MIARLQCKLHQNIIAGRLAKLGLRKILSEFLKESASVRFVWAGLHVKETARCPATYCRKRKRGTVGKGSSTGGGKLGVLDLECPTFGEG